MIQELLLFLLVLVLPPPLPSPLRQDLLSQLLQQNQSKVNVTVTPVTGVGAHGTAWGGVGIMVAQVF